MKFNNDINGLRAISVLVVSIFHFYPNILPGGFIGVDVFFVISGFLMTGIIYSRLESNSFNLVSFYSSRINRIVPPLFFLIFSLLIIGYFLLIPIDFKNLAKHSYSSLGFFSNIIYWLESGYFNSSSKEKWLLHTWSLSVEWQFYIIYPFLLMCLKKLFTINKIRFPLLIITLACFFIGHFISFQWRDFSYYGLPSRVWEMLVGSMAYLYPIRLNEKYKIVCNYIGILFIVFPSVFYFNSTMVWPGHYALVPVVGAYFVIISNYQKNNILNSNLMHFIGKSSYSIYLWHWPVLVCIYYFKLDIPLVFGLIVGFSLGMFSYLFIEKINFHIVSRWWGFVKSLPVVLSLVVSFFGLFVYFCDGLYTRFSKEELVNIYQEKEAIGDWGYPNANLVKNGISLREIKGDSNENILFIGASHIEHTYPYIKKHNKKYNVYYMTQGGCFVSKSYRHPRINCSNIQNYEKIFEVFNFDKIVVSLYCLDCYLTTGSSDEREKDFLLRVSEFNDFLYLAKKYSKNIYLVLGEPKGEIFDPKMSVRLNLPDKIEVKKVRDLYALHYRALKLLDLSGVIIIDPIDYLCDQYCYSKSGDKFIYKDQEHIRPMFAENLFVYFDQVLK